MGGNTLISVDAANASFELIGALMNALSVKRLWRDKEIKGVHWAPTVFFLSWGLWNIFYYPHLHQWLSFYAGLCLISVNIIWIGMLIFFSRFVTKKGHFSVQSA